MTVRVGLLLRLALGAAFAAFAGPPDLLMRYAHRRPPRWIVLNYFLTVRWIAAAGADGAP